MNLMIDESGKRKPVRLSMHARLQLPFRGVTEEEVVEAIYSEAWSLAESGRFECRKNFPFGKKWNGKTYATKQVHPIFVEEAEEGIMKITYEAEVDALYIRFRETTVTTQHLAEGLTADYDADGHLAGIEVLDAVKRFGSKDVFKQVILEDIALVSGK